MSTTFGGTIKLDGEKEYRQALKQISQELKVAGSEMKVVTAEFGKNNNSVEALTVKNKVLSKEIEKQEEKVALLNGAFKDAAEKYGENSKQALNYKSQLNNATAQLISMNKEVESNEKAISEAGNASQEASKDFDKLGDEVKGSAKEAESSESKFKKVGSVISGMAKAAGAAMAAIGTATIAAGKKLTDFAQETATHGDEIDKMSQKLGLSAKAYQQWDYVLSQSGVDITSMTTGMKTLTNQIDDAKNGSADAQNRFKKLGISMNDLKTMSREDIFAATIAGFQKMSDSTDRAALANDLFGKSGQNLTPLFNQTNESTKELMKTAEEMGFVMSDKSVKAAAAFNDSMDTLKRTFSGVKNNIMGELLPGFTQITTGLADLLAGNKEATAEIQNGAKELASSLSTIMPGIVDICLNLVGAVAEIAPTVIEALVSGIVDNSSSLISSANKIIITFLESLIEALPQVSESALQLILTLTSGVLENLQPLIDAAIQVILTLATGLSEALPSLIPTVVETVLTITDTLIDNIDMLIDAAISIIIALADGLMRSLPKLTERLPTIIIKVTDTLISNAPKLISASILIIKTLASGLIKSIPDLVRQVPQIISSIKSSLDKGKDKFLEVGKNILTGLWEGIKNTKQWLVDKIKSLGSTILNAAKSALGIHSPSKLFEDEVGVMTAKGIGVGFEKEMVKVNRTIKNALPTHFETGVDTTIQSSVSVNAAQSVATAVVSALKQFKGQVILSESAVGEFVIDTVTREVFA